MVVACCALFVALGGTSYALAVGSIGTREIRDDSVRSIDVHNRSLKGNDLHADSIGGGAIKEETLDVSKLRLPPAPANALLQALIYADGSRHNARGVVDVRVHSSGSYTVVFDRDVTRCVVAATLSELANGNATGIVHTRIAVSPTSSESDAINVLIVSDRNELVARDFYLLMSC
jgi:hypothetical protein